MQSIAERRADNYAHCLKRSYLHTGQVSATYALLAHFSSRRFETTRDAIKPDAVSRPTRGIAIIDREQVPMDHWLVSRQPALFIREDGALASAGIDAEDNIIGYSYVENVEHLDFYTLDSVIFGLNLLLVNEP